MDSLDSCRISVPGSTQEHGGRQSVFAYGAVTLFGRLSHTFPLTDYFVTSICRSYNPEPASRLGLGCSPFARHYWGNNFFSSGYLDVSVPQVPVAWSIYSTRDTVGSQQLVSLFGNPRINACTRLPEAYRSVPRPSSAFDAKASIISS